MAVIKGRSRGNGSQLADYLLHNQANERVQVLDIRGTCNPEDLKKSLLEMSLTSELTKGVHGLYHAQINPAIGEDKPMEQEDWLKAVEILEKHLGFDNQKRVIVLHEKKGRTHAHIAWERYDHDAGRLIDDGMNYKKHDKAREEIELFFGHQRTRQQEREIDPKEHKKGDYKRELSDLWKDANDGKSFIQEAEKAGYKIAVGDDRRPWRVITPEGESLDLVRQLEAVKTKDVRERLQPIRDQLLDEATAIRSVKDKQLEHDSGVSHDISNNQDKAIGLLKRFQQKEQAREVTQKQTEHIKEIEQEKAQDLTDNQEKASDLLERFRARQEERKQQLERERKLRELKQNAKEQTERAEQDDRASDLLRQYRERQEQKRNRGLEI